MPNKIAQIRNGNLWSKSIDICLSNLNGQTCPNEFLKTFETQLKLKGYRVSCNNPFRGAALIRKNAHPSRKIYALQIEINKSLYMNEKNFEIRTEQFDELQNHLKEIFFELIKQSEDFKN